MAATDTRARTLESDHFLIHYSLRGLHRVHMEPGDSALARVSDSLYAAFRALPAPQRDSAVYAGLDSGKLPHPIYIRKTRDYFEAARAYYVGTLGMNPPVSAILSLQYKVAGSAAGKFPVDVVDVGTADRRFVGETYGVTYPPDRLSITFENDFICRDTLDAGGRIVGDSISSRLSGRLIHNYAAEWEYGIKVTAFHEYYHAVQFAYTPDPEPYHAWYELSATGMEERNAGEVNDYLQYLPCVLFNHATVPLNGIERGPCTHDPMYGQSIFHQYLGKTLDSAFDVRVWEQLRRNGNAFRDGLETAFAHYGQSMAKLYPDYSAQLLFSGRRFPPPARLFSPDMPLWPDAAVDSVDMAQAGPFKLISLPALTFGILKVKWGAKARTRILQAKGVTGITRVYTGADSSLLEHPPDTEFALGPPREGYGGYYLILPNASYTDEATIEIKDPEPAFFAFPNPAAMDASGLRFSQSKGMTFPARVRIYAENGRLVRSLSFSADDPLAWDLKSDAGEAVRPGVYYYRLADEPLRALVLGE